LLQIKKDKEKKHLQENEEISFMPVSTLPRFIFNKDAGADKLNEGQSGLSNFLRRKNASDEEDDDFTKLPDENMVVASWINDIGYNH
jgi:hypothetical protein